MATVLPVSAREPLVYIGTYTKAASKGIYVARFDTETGKLGEPTLAVEAANPSFLALSVDRKQLYAVSESGDANYQGKSSGTVNAYSVNADGSLGFLNTAVSAGKGPCYISTTPDGKTVLVANYGSGTVASLSIQANGGLGDPTSVDQHEGQSVHPTRQKGPYAHSILPSLDGQFAFSADLGTDRVYTYRLDAANGTLTPIATTGELLEPGSGPRHLALSPDGRHVYLVNELSSSVTTLAFDPVTGGLKPLQRVPTLPADYSGKNTGAEVAVHPSGRFVYASNRGHDSIAIFRVDKTTGTLTPSGHVPTQGKNPRNFAIDPSGRWLIAANQDGNSLVVYSIDQETGRLTPTGQTVALSLPVCVRFL